MVDITDDEFANTIAEVMDELPRDHMDAVRNVAIVYADEPTVEQRQQLRLRQDQSLFGLYEGVPLPRRAGRNDMYGPDKITIFKKPLLAHSDSYTELRAHIKHTVWHEVAHYFGLDHEQIHRLERRPLD